MREEEDDRRDRERRREEERKKTERERDTKPVLTTESSVLADAATNEEPETAKDTWIVADAAATNVLQDVTSF